ncbi:MAG: propionate kinase, partial [Spirochaetia bacterium]
ITEKWVDRRDIEIAAEEGNERAQLAIEMESYRLRKYIGAYAAALGRVDAVIFTAGVGERGPITRQKAVEGLGFMGIEIDRDKNYASMTKSAETIISADSSPAKVMVIPTDEELVMTEDTVAILEDRYDVHTNFTYTFQSPDYVNHEREKKLQKDLKKWEGLDQILAKKR